MKDTDKVHGKYSSAVQVTHVPSIFWLYLLILLVRNLTSLKGPSVSNIHLFNSSVIYQGGRMGMLF